LAGVKHKLNVILIDYSEIYYSSVAKTAMPDKLTGKFVQIRNDNTEYLIFSPKEFTSYHANLVERFCLETGLNGYYNTEGKRFDIHDPAWVIVGGGKFEIDKMGKYIRLYDNSMAYGRFDSKGLKDKILLIDEMSDYKVQIE
jgi:hypothetical protein